MPILIVERSFGHPLSPEEVDHLFTKLGPCLGQYDVRWMHSYLSRDRARMLCVFEATDAETVRMAHRNAGVSHGMVWPADRLAADPRPESDLPQIGYSEVKDSQVHRTT